MLKLKRGVSIAGIRQEIAVALVAAHAAFADADADLVVTSCTGGEHMRHSLHHVGQAVDLRVRHIEPNVSRRVAREIADALGETFDVIHEGDHIHIEFQP